MNHSDPSNPERLGGWLSLTRLPILILSTAFLVFALREGSAVGEEPFENETQYNTFLSGYYLHPDPDNVGRFLCTIESRKLHERENGFAPLVGFLAEIFAANPDRIEAWVEPYRGQEPREYLLSALWFADTDESRLALNQLAEAAEGEEVEAYAGYVNESPPAIGTRPVESGADLDFLWARYTASGNTEYVVRIIDQLRLMIPNEDGMVRGEGYAAEWSLTGMGLRDERVRQTLREEAARREGEIRELLDGILANIDSKLAERAR